MRALVMKLSLLGCVGSTLLAFSTLSQAQSPDVILECGKPEDPTKISIVIPGNSSGTAYAAGKAADRFSTNDRQYVLAYKPLADSCWIIEGRAGGGRGSQSKKFWTVWSTQTYSYGRYNDLTGGWNGQILCGYEEIVVDRYTGNVQTFGPVKKYRNNSLEANKLRGWRGEPGIAPDEEDRSIYWADSNPYRDSAPQISGICQPAARRL